MSKRLHASHLSISSGFNGQTWFWTCRVCVTRWLWPRVFFNNEWRITDFHCPDCCGQRLWCRKAAWVNCVIAKIVFPLTAPNT